MKKYSFPIWSLNVYIPLLLLSISLPHTTPLSFFLSLTRSASLLPHYSVSLFCRPSLFIPAVAKAMVFCGGSWLGLICQSADLPSLLFCLFALSSTFFLVFSGVKTIIFTLACPEQLCETTENHIFQFLSLRL